MNKTYRSYQHNLVIRRIQGYTESNTGRDPVWGERLAIYHPITSDITYLDKTAWGVYDSISTGISGDEYLNTNRISRQEYHEIIQNLTKAMLVSPIGEKYYVNVKPDFKSDAELYMQVTEACNFACPGCATGVDRFKAGMAKTLDESTLESYLTLAVASAAKRGIKSLRIKWAGGEVMMALPSRLLKGAQTVIKNLQQKYPEVELSQIILTNGSHFTEENVRFICDTRAHVSVSLWGLGSLNDESRGVRRSQDKFSSIIEGIKRLHESGGGFNVDHVVTPGNSSRFGDFITALWDIQNNTFIGKNWQWNEPIRPIACGIEFFRPQTILQMTAMKKIGYNKMVNGLRYGFDSIRRMIENGVQIQPFDRIDYLQLFGIIPSPCGTGHNYFAAGPKGVASCHQGLFDMKSNSQDILSGKVDFIQQANSEHVGNHHDLLSLNIKYEQIDPTIQLILKLHGGSGCPRTARDENNGKMGYAASSSAHLYAPIIEELIALETMRRMKAQNVTTTTATPKPMCV